MAKIKNFIYCLNVNVVDKRVDIIGLLNKMEPDYIPGVFSFFINFSLMDMKEGKHKIALYLKDSQDKVVASIEDYDIEYKRTSDGPEEYSGINFAISLQNVKFEQEGIYYTQLFFDEADLGKYEILVKERAHGNDTAI